MTLRARAQSFPFGAGVTVEQLDGDPHPVHARLRETEPVSWLPSLDGWLVTRHDLVLAAMRDDQAFTVDDPRFTTARVIGPSMLSTDGREHARHRTPFVAPFRIGAVRDRFADVAAAEVERLLDRLAATSDGAELRSGFAGPLAAAIITRALGLGANDVEAVRAAYDAIVTSVNGMSAGHAPSAAGRAAFGRLRGRLLTTIIADRPDSNPPDSNPPDSLLSAAAAGATLTDDQIVADAAVLMFGGIETTEGMIANAVLMLLGHPEALAQARADPGALEAAIEESLRLEPAAAVVDRYATADVELGGAAIAAGDLVRISIAGANRDPAVFADPDRFWPGRGERRHLAFAQGPHVCVGVHLARLEARLAVAGLLGRFPRLRGDPQRPAAVRGLVFRKPPRLDVLWD